MVIKKVNKLNRRQIKDVMELINQCRAEEPTMITPTMTNEGNFDPDLPCMFLCEENGYLISFVSIFMPSPYYGEVVGFTFPAARRRGYFMKTWLEAGIKVIPVVPSVAMAKLVTRLGASAVIAEGGESGGHVGELTTMVLVPLIRDATDLPVIAADGIADGRGAAAAFMLGACGIQMGTRFLSAEECTIHPTYKEKIVKANDLCTMVTGKRLGHPVRSLRTQFARNYSKAEYGGMPDEELEALGTGALRKAVQEGDVKDGCFLSGQIAAMVNKVEPAADIVRDVMEGAEAVLKGAAKWVE